MSFIIAKISNTVALNRYYEIH